MSLFKYTVTNRKGKKLTGTVEADEENAARKELNSLGFSIISLTLVEGEEEKIQEGHIKFEFEAKENTGKIIKGSIPAKDKESAILRLRQEYVLKVSAIWPQGSTAEEIELARQEGEARLEKEITPTGEGVDQVSASESSDDATVLITPEKMAEERFLRDKIDLILSKVDNLLTKYSEDLDEDIKADIKKKIDKLMRIKNSKNLEYIQSTADELLAFIQKQEKNLEEKGLHDKRFQFNVETKSITRELHKTIKPKSLSEDISQKITNWKKKHRNIEETKQSFINKTISKSILWAEKTFKPNPEISSLKTEIKSYRKQRWEFITLYFKEPTKEYKQKVVDSIKDINQKIKESKNKIRDIKGKAPKAKSTFDTTKVAPFIKELNSLTGWILAIYLVYYFLALLLNTKDFGLSEIPRGLTLYDSQLFKYVLVVMFLLHASSSIKINFLNKNKIANFVIPPLFIIITLITILNF